METLCYCIIEGTIVLSGKDQGFSWSGGTQILVKHGTLLRCPASVVPARQPRPSPWNLCEGEYKHGGVYVKVYPCQGRSGTYKNCVTSVSENGGFRKKKFKPGVSQNTGYFIWLICFDPSNFKATSCSKAVTRQGNELLAYDCHQLTLFPRRISSYPKNFKMLLFVARVTEDVGDLSSLALAFC